MARDCGIRITFKEGRQVDGGHVSNVVDKNIVAVVVDEEIGQSGLFC